MPSWLNTDYWEIPGYHSNDCHLNMMANEALNMLALHFQARFGQVILSKEAISSDVDFIWVGCDVWIPGSFRPVPVEITLADYIEKDEQDEEDMEEGEYPYLYENGEGLVRNVREAIGNLIKEFRMQIGMLPRITRDSLPPSPLVGQSRFFFMDEESA